MGWLKGRLCQRGNPEEQSRSRRPSAEMPSGEGRHEPYESRGSRTVLWAAGGEIPLADPAAYLPQTVLSR
jgi:hypothetical protein